MNVDALVIVVAAVALGSLLKGITGVGGPIIAVPVIAAFLGVEPAVVIMAIPGVFMNGWMLWKYRAAAHRTRDLPVLVVTGAVGVAVGTWVLASVDDRALSLFLAVVMLTYLASRLVNPNFEFSRRATRVLSPMVGLGSGAMQGATGISAPLVATYVHGLNLPRDGYVLAVSVLFQVFSVAQVVAIAVAGLYTRPRLIESALACVPAVALIPLGDRIGRRLSARAFDAVVLVSLAALAAKLLYDVVR